MLEDTHFNSTLEACVALLTDLVRTPSFSKEEGATAGILAAFFKQQGLSDAQRSGHNVWVRHPHWRDGLPVVLLNSHHDTVRPTGAWTYPPLAATWDGDRLVGLGANDAGGPLVSLIGAFLLLSDRTDLPYNLVLAATAEEEISGPNGIASILPLLGTVDCGIVGEPTSLAAAIAERGLVVIDGEATGVAGHAARDEGTNALYIALDDIQRLRGFAFPEVSETLGAVKVSVTQMGAGSQHNVVPDKCHFVVDVRVNDCYTNEAVVAQLQALCQSTLTPRSLRLQPSGIAPGHPLVRAIRAAGLDTYGSPTLSDQAMMPFPTVKLGPGDSARSHTADEYIYRHEIAAGIATYLLVLGHLSF